jgi:prepilin-type N-terminal cleavage/methylation domain-containing protein
MPILCQNNHHPKNINPHRSHISRNLLKGFTLIEMMAVMVLLGLLAGIVLPGFERWFNSTQDNVTIIEISNRLQKLIVRSALLEQDFELNEKSAKTILADGQAALDLPAGWMIGKDQKLNIWKSGMCDSSYITFTTKKEKITFNIDKENCHFSLKEKVKIFEK